MKYERLGEPTEGLQIKVEFIGKQQL